MANHSTGALEIMIKKKYFSKNRGGNLCQPLCVGDILREMLLSDSPLAQGYRRYLAAVKAKAEKGGQWDE